LAEGKPQEELENLAAHKDEVARRWPSTDLCPVHIASVTLLKMASYGDGD
jgi:hypothetical protein